MSEIELTTSQLKDRDLGGVQVTVGEGMDNRGIDPKKLHMGNPIVNMSYMDNIKRVWKLDQLGNILLKNLSKNGSRNESPTIFRVQHVHLGMSNIRP